MSEKIEKMVVEGGHRLEGEVTISGAKNAALPILAATLLTTEPCTIEHVPFLSDIGEMIDILHCLGVKAEHKSDGSVVTQVTDEKPITAPYELVRKMRASICVLGPLLARRKRAKVSMPGGCVIGVRPIDLHLKGMAALGANISIEHGYIHAEAPDPKLIGREMFLGGAFGSTVLGTANVMMAAVLAQGTTVIENAACEPEVQDLGNFLNDMGAKITGAGSHRIVIEGVEELHGAKHRVIPDRIEAGTFMAAAAMSDGDITIKNLCLDHLLVVVDKLHEMGVKIKKLPAQPGEFDQIRIIATRAPKAIDIITLPYPNFPTDLQAQFVALLSLVPGISIVNEKIFPDRFMHVAELQRMGANIRKEGATLIVQGVDFLSGAPVMATDLRASAAMVLAGLVARGETVIEQIYHLDRGYERIDEKLAPLGAKIRRIS